MRAYTAPLLLLLAACNGVVDGSGTSPAAIGGAGPAPIPTATGASAASGGQPALGTGGSEPAAGGSATQPGPGGTPSAAGAPNCVSLSSPGAPVPMRRLLASQVERSVQALLGVTQPLGVTDERILTFRSNVSSSVDSASARGYFDFASAVAAAADLDRCEDDCSEWLLDEIGRGLFRRPLDQSERERYSDLYSLAAEDGSPREAAGWVLEAMLQSPSFLYLDEVVESDGRLDQYAVASRLSLLLWGQNPDSELLEQAEQRALGTPEQLRAAVNRLLADPRANAGFAEFVDQWLDLGRLDDPDVRPDLAELGAETVTDLRTEPVKVFTALLRGSGTLTDLLTTRSTAASTALEPLYGADILSKTTSSFELDPRRRGGILSLPGVAAALSHAKRTSPTVRGKALLTSFLCAPPPPPPAGVSVNLPEVGDDVSSRERFELHQSDPGCASCHRMMDGMGFALEKLDWLGRSRDEESGHEIDDRSTFTIAGTEVTIQGPAELGQMLAARPEVASCVAKQWLEYALGVPVTAEARCLVERLAADLGQAGGLQRLLETTLSSDWFLRGPGGLP